MGRAPLRSCLYECTVMHHRLVPRRHRFNYRVFLFCLDLDELDAVAENVAGFSRNAWNFYSFRDRDHLPLPGRDLKESLRGYLAGEGVDWPESGRAVLVTFPRVLGYVFNPVSFYFCFDGEGEPLCAVAEVGNTFGELKPYLLRDRQPGGGFRRVVPKHFYVSPFSDLELCFDFQLRLPGERLQVRVDDRRGDSKELLSTVAGRRVDLDSWTLFWMTLKYPLITLRVIFLIHWNALLIWAKRVPFHEKTANMHLQRGVLRPRDRAGQPSP